MNAERCDHFIHAHLDGSLSNLERAEFETLLLASESARQRFWELAEVHGLAGEAARIAWGEPEEAASASENGSFEAGGRGKWRWVRPLVSIAAAAMVLFAAYHYFVRPATEKPNSTTAASDVIATLLLTEECVWRGGNVWLEGQSLHLGQVLCLVRGLAVLRFESGAEVVMNEATELLLESRGSLRLLGGRLTIRASEDAAGFIVRTEASDVTDLGTEFTVSVGDKGATEVHVLEGQVSLGRPGAPQARTQLLDAGRAVRIERGNANTPSAVPVVGTRFAELLDVATAKPRRGWLMVSEAFEYPPGRLPLNQANRGYGWASPWWITRTAPMQPVDDGALDVAIGQLNQSWPVAGGHGLALRANEGFASRFRSMERPLRLDRDGIYYLSLIVRQEPPANAGSEPLRVKLGLRSSDKMFADRILFRVGAVGKRQIEVRNGETFISPSAVARQGAQFWVGKIVARAQGEDEIFFRVYEDGEPFDLMEPASWSVQTRGVQSDAQLDVVELSVSGPSVCWFDELRIGKNWRAAVFAPNAVAFDESAVPSTTR
jgi:ferric-dicitrate binding protein FerR (iron transport regulator)